MKKKYLSSVSAKINQERAAKLKKRNKDSELQELSLGSLIYQARLKKGLSMEQVAEFAKTDQSYIFKLERDLKNVRFSTLLRIIEEGLGGQLQITINF